MSQRKTMQPHGKARQLSTTSNEIDLTSAQSFNIIRNAAEQPKAIAHYEKVEDMARQVTAEQLLSASLQTSDQDIYRATVAGAILGIRDDIRVERTQGEDALWEELRELREEVVDKEMMVRNMNTTNQSLLARLDKMQEELEVCKAETRNLNNRVIFLEHQNMATSTMTHDLPMR